MDDEVRSYVVILSRQQACSLITHKILLRSIIKSGKQIDWSLKRDHEGGNYSVRVYLSFIQYKSHEMESNHEITFYS